MSSTRKTRFGAVSAISACFLILGVLSAVPASAATTCTKNNAVLTVTVDPSAVIVRSGDDITVTGAACPAGSTVNDIDQINVEAPGGGGGNEAVTIDMSGGKFAPGLNNEPSGQSEIEITVDLKTGSNTLTILGTGSSDRWAFNTQGIDLNNDGDSDVTGKTNGPGFDNLGNANLAVTANGQSGNDTFIQKQLTTEAIIGGDGAADSVEYKLRTNPVTVTLEGTANDGETGELDNLSGDIEVVRGGSGNDNFTGTTGSQLFYGYNGNDNLDGGDGADALNGGSGLSVSDDGTDTLTGGAGGDSLRGGSNVDTITGGSGRDNVTGGAGNDSETGGGGRDQFDQEASANGADVINGGDGNDTVLYNKRSAALNVTLDGNANDGAAGETDNVQTDVENIQSGRGNDTLDGSATNVAHNISGGIGTDTITGANVGDNLSGGDGVDTITGNEGGDKIFAGDSNDTVNGNDGADSIFGGDGADQLHGGQGNDRLYGGGGTGDNDLCEDPNAKTYRTGCESK